LTHFPPTFIVHCTDDPDVPIASSRELSKAVSNSEFLELHVAEHDFDREKNPIADDVYQKLRAWLFKTI
jgi:pimeloyl-ACP methyl ester carboxylesterase